MISKNKLVEYFFKGIKEKSILKIGVEHEKFILNNKTFKQLSYYESNGIKDIFLNLVTKGWEPIYEGEDNNIIALKKNNEQISLEPGGQIELSGAQLQNIHQTCNETTNHLTELKETGKEMNFILLGMGVEPSLSLNDFSWMPKERYNIMKEYMPKVCKLGHHMMKRTCTNQINLDYFSEEDMKIKFRIMLNLESVATAIFANSPFDQKKISKYKSLRSYFWQETDSSRTGLLPFVFKDNFSFEKYVDYALDIKMYFIKRNNKYINMTDYTFRDFFNNKIDKLTKYDITIEDWIDHLSTLFPQIRLKNYLEVRSMDACNWDLICSPPAFWTGLLYNDDSIDSILEIVDDWTDQDREYLNLKVPVYGLQTKFRDTTVLELARRFFEISKSGLEKRNILNEKSKFNETIFLNKLEKNLTKGISPADDLLKKYNYKWNNKIELIYKEMIY